MKKPIHDYYGAGTPTMTEICCDRCGADAEHEVEGEDLCVGCAEKALGEELYCWVCGEGCLNATAQEMDRRCGSCMKSHPLSDGEPDGDDPILGMGYSGMYGGHRG